MLVDGDLMKSWPAWKIYNKLNTSETRAMSQAAMEDRIFLLDDLGFEGVVE